MPDFGHIEFVYPDGDPRERARTLWSFAERTDGFSPAIQQEGSVDEMWSLFYDPDGTDGEVRVSVEPFAVEESWYLAPDLPVLQLSYDAESFRLADRSRTLDQFLTVVERVYTVTDAAFCYGLSPIEAEIFGEFPDSYRLPVDRDHLEQGQIADVCWLLLFPPRFVEQYGRAWLRDAPVARVRLVEGSLLLLADETPWDDDPDRRALQSYFGFEERY